MSNIHTLSDVMRNNKTSGQESCPFIGCSTEGTSDGDKYAINFPNTNESSENNEGRATAIKFMQLLFPHIRWQSYLAFIVIIQWIIYIVSLAISSETVFTAPSGEALSKLGANIPAKIVHLELWRLVTPIFLHSNLLHIFLNTFFEMRIGFGIEKRYGYFRFLLLFFLSGILGNIFSAVCGFCEMKVGASTSGFGMIGVQLVELFLGWSRIRHRERMLVNVFLFALMMLVMMSGFGNDSVDQMGHLGGFVCGVLLGLLYNYLNEAKPLRYYYFKESVVIFILLSFAVSTTTVLFAVPRKCA